MKSLRVRCALCREPIEWVPVLPARQLTGLDLDALTWEHMGMLRYKHEATPAFSLKEKVSH